MSTKENFNKAMFDMFGVGKEGEEVTAPELDASEKVAEAAASVIEKVSPVHNTYIAPGVYIEGNITSKGNVEIAGELKGDLAADGVVTVKSNVVGNITANTIMLNDCCVTGDVKSASEVVVTEKSIVNGNIVAKSLDCAGKVNGDLDVSENMSLAGSACVIGKIITSTMTMEKGAVVKGTVEMREGE